MVIYSRSSIQIINNRKFWIRKNKCIIKFNKQSADIDKIYLYPKDPYKAKYQYLINKRESAGQSILMILKILFDNQMVCKILIKILIKILKNII